MRNTSADVCRKPIPARPDPIAAALRAAADRATTPEVREWLMLMAAAPQTSGGGRAAK